VKKKTITEQLRQKTAQLAAVREISRAIAEAQDVDTTLDLITQRTTEAMGVQSCSIYLYNREETELVLAATTGLNRSGIGQMRLGKGAGLTGWAAEHGELVAVANAADDPRFQRLQPLWRRLNWSTRRWYKKSTIGLKTIYKRLPCCCACKSLRRINSPPKIFYTKPSTGC
jgi:GAF domain-containing protein